MAKQDFIIKQQGQLSSDPSSPPAGYSAIFPKTDGKWYVKNSDGTVTEITNTLPAINAASNLYNYYNFK